MSDLEKKTVVVGMSGGVDSSVTAYLLKEQGYNVIGVTMQIWQEDTPGTDDDDGACCGFSAIQDAKKVCRTIGIPHYVMNFKEVFKETVIDNFIKEYVAGRTPNPCNMCNRYVKWEALLHRAMEIGADYIATGHYARVTRLSNGRYAIQRSATDKKDQTYALYNLTQEQLAHTLFPLGDYEKPKVREIAEKIGLVVAHKKDSQDICFIPDNDYGKYLSETGIKLPEEGDFVDTCGNVLGRHKGIHNYTIGQRKGLGISAEHPLFVCDIDVENNKVVLGRNEDCFTDVLYCGQLNFQGISDFEDGQRVLAKIRYSAPAQECIISRIDETHFMCKFIEPVRAVTPGQAVVFYDGDVVLAGGIIERR